MNQSRFLRGFNPLLAFCRTKKAFNWQGEGIKYDGFKYYPRYPDFQDPPYEATKLFRVTRIKPLKHTLNSQKQILKEFGLDGKCHQVSIVKNIPENNHRLWKVKELIKIEPITFPDGFPQDGSSTYLKENGELQVIRNVSTERLALTDDFVKDERKLDGHTLRRQSRYHWNSGWD